MTTARSPRMRQRIRQRRQPGNNLAAQPDQQDQKKKLRHLVSELRNIVDKQARQIKEERRLMDHINRLIKVSRKGGQR